MAILWRWIYQSEVWILVSSNAQAKNSIRVWAENNCNRNGFIFLGLFSTFTGVTLSLTLTNEKLPGENFLWANQNLFQAKEKILNSHFNTAIIEIKEVEAKKDDNQQNVVQVRIRASREKLYTSLRKLILYPLYFQVQNSVKLERRIKLLEAKIDNLTRLIAKTMK